MQNDTLPKWRTMDTAPQATKENPVLLYYNFYGVIPFAERFGSGWSFRTRRWVAGGADVYNFIGEEPVAWTPMKENEQ